MTNLLYVYGNLDIAAPASPKPIDCPTPDAIRK